jgi:hypothetical protein
LDNTSDVNKTSFNCSTNKALNLKEDKRTRDEARLAGLGSDGTSSLLPSITVTDTFVVAFHKQKCFDSR